MPQFQASVQECRKRAPEVHRWVEHMVDYGVGGGDGGVGEVPVLAEVVVLR